MTADGGSGLRAGRRTGWGAARLGAACVGLLLGGAHTAAAQALQFTPASLSFGNQMVGTTSAAQTITVKNTGTSTATISQDGYSDPNDFGFAQTCGGPLAAGATCTVTITFHPARAGAISTDITFTDNAPGSPQTVVVTGTGVAQTTTTLSVTSGGSAVTTVASGSVVTLTAAVVVGTAPVSGQVAFCNATIATTCTGIHLLGTAQVTSAGTATYRFVPGIGSHSYRAVFLGTSSYAGSASSAAALTVTGTIPTKTTIAQSGAAGNYTLTATTAGAPYPAQSPTQSVTINLGQSTQSYVLTGTGGTAGNGGTYGNYYNTQGSCVTSGSTTTCDLTGPFTSSTPGYATGTYDFQTVFTGNIASSVTSQSQYPVGTNEPNDFQYSAFAPSTTMVLKLHVTGGGAFTIPLVENGNFDPSLDNINFADTAPVCGGTSLGSDPCQQDYVGTVVGATYSSPVTGLVEFEMASQPTLVGPTGTVSFLDTSNANGVLGTAALGTATTGFGLVQPTGSPVSAGSGPYDVVTGDFNGDGLQDFVVLLDDAEGVVVLLGNGDGTFQPADYFQVGALPERVLAADLNGDGKLDLIVSNSGGGTIGVLLGTGNGMFLQREVEYATNGSPAGLGVMDINHDGIPDVVAVNYDKNTMAVLLGKSDGTLQAAVTYPTGNTPQTVVEGDFNGDGNVDVVVGNQKDGTVGVFLGNGDGTFQAMVTYPVGSRPQGMQVGDFNGDGVLDLAVADSTDDAVGILLGNGDGTFGSQATYPAGSGPYALAVADVNGDGDPDIAVVNQSDNTISMLLGNGDGTFQTQVTVPTGTLPYGLAAADFNGDGLPDLAVANFTDLTATIFLSKVTETAVATATGIAPTGAGAHNVDANYPGDMNFGASTSATTPLMSSGGTGTSLSATALAIAPSNSVTYTTQVTLTATVTGATAGAVPTGTVTFYNGTTALGTGTLDATGTTTYTSAQFAVGTQMLTAAYSGDQLYAGSTSPEETLTVNAGGLVINPAKLAFGNQMVGTTSAAQQVTVTNPGATTINFQQITSELGADPAEFLENDNCPAALVQNASCTLNISFAPTAVGGATAGVAIVDDSTPGLQDVAVSGTGTGGILQVNPGNLKTIAGNGTIGYTGDGGQATAAELKQPNGIAFDPSGNLYIADDVANVVRKVDTTGKITTFAGNGTGGYTGDGGQATAAELFQPFSVASDAAGNIYIQDTGNNVVRKVDTTGKITTFAGTGAQGHSGDGGPAIDAKFNQNQGARFDSAGNLYVPTCFGASVRKIDTSGNISTVAGNFTEGYSGDGGAATSAQLQCPSGVTIDAAGNLYIADEGNQVIRKVDTTGTITTIAGSPAGTPGFGGDGGPATAALFNLPNDVVVDAAGNIYVADSANNRVRMIDTTGKISTLAGGLNNAGSAGVNTPLALTVGPSGNVYFSDSSNGAVREVFPTGTTPFPSTAVGATAVQTLSLSNIGNLAITIPASDSFTLGGDATDFALTGGTCLQGTTLAGGQGSCTLQISFTPTAVGQRTLTVSIADNALNSPQSFTIGGVGTPGVPTLAWTAPASILYGTPLSATQLDATAANAAGTVLPGTFVYTPAAGTVPTAGTQTLSVTFTPTDAVDYTTATITVPITVMQFIPALTWATPAPITTATPLSGTQLDAAATDINGAPIAGTYEYTPPAGTLLAAGTYPIGVTFTPTDTVDFLGPVSTTRSLVVTQATATTTTTTLAVTSGGETATTVASGSVVTLTAAVLVGTAPVSPGQVAFCDATAATCTDIHLLGTAQITPAGTATYRFIPGIGSHSYKAIFLGTTANAGSASAAAALAVTGKYATTTALAASGVEGSYALTATVDGFGLGSPSGSVAFTDTSTSGTLGTVPVSGVVQSFVSGTPITVGSSPNIVVSADVNGDGKPDLVVANQSGAMVTVLIGNGDGTYTASPSFGNNNGGVGIAVGDFNGDGKLDIATANGSSVGIFLGNGDGTFGAEQDFANTGSSKGVSAADVNGDGKLDLVVTDNGSGITIMIGNGDGTFTQLGEALASGGGPNFQLAVADFNGDGKLDIAAGNRYDNTLSLLLGNGDGTFQPQTVIAAGSAPKGCFAGDFNGDGYQDIILTNGNGASISVLLGNGDGTFQAEQTFAVGPNPWGAAVSDLNGDGKPDVAVANQDDGTVSVLFGNGDGTFQPQKVVASSGAEAVAIGDTNGDGSPDIVVPNSGSNTTAVFLNETTAAMSLTGVTLPGSGSDNVVATYSGDSSFAGSTSNTVTLPSHPAVTTPVVTWATPAAIVYGTALSATQLDAVATNAAGTVLAGTFVYTPAIGAVLNAGTQKLSVTFTPTDTTDYTAATQTVNIVVSPATSTLAWATPANLVYGTALSATQLDATAATQAGATLAGTFVYTPAIGAVLNAGTQKLSVTFTPTDTNYAAATGTVNIVVSPAASTLAWATPANVVYGTALSATQLDATATGVGGSGLAGTFVYTPAAGAVLAAGTYRLSATFTPTSTNYAAATITVPITVTQATPTLAWAAPASIAYGTALSATQLDATATGVSGTAALPGTFVYTPAAGAVLAPGTQKLTVTFTATDAADYTAATGSVNIVVSGLSLASVSPATLTLGGKDTTITLTGSGFVTNSVAQVNGTAIATTYVGPTTLTAVVPAADLAAAGTLDITVYDAAIEATSTSQPLMVVAPPVAATLSGPTTTAPGTQPSVSLTVTNPYPLPLTAVFTLSFAASGNAAVDDPAIQFASGGRSFTLTVPANSTVVPPVELQAGTDAGTITIGAVLTAGGVNVTPASLVPVVITIPPVAPVLSGTTVTRAPGKITVVVHGFSNTREVSVATFHFTAATGADIGTPDVKVPATTLFGTWFDSTESETTYGSTFTYTQIFNVSGGDETTIGSVKVTLTNTVGDGVGAVTQ